MFLSARILTTKRKVMEKEMYEKAINAYNFHVQRYNTWMNQYAIFVGAIFVAYYHDFEKSGILPGVVLLIGVSASICWLGSFYGYYAWLKSWIRILHLKEEQYLKSQTNSNDLKVYSVVVEEDVKNTGFSTQKITLIFIWIVIIAWFALFTAEINKFIKSYYCFGCCTWICSIAITVIFAAICILIIVACKKNLLSDINKLYWLQKDGSISSPKERRNNN